MKFYEYLVYAFCLFEVALPLLLSARKLSKLFCRTKSLYKIFNISLILQVCFSKLMNVLGNADILKPR
jgi:hypothetical protein